METIKEMLGERIRAARVGLKLSQAELSRAAGLKGKNTLSSIEKGHTWPTYETIEAIAKALGIPAESLFYFGTIGVNDALWVLMDFVAKHRAKGAE